MCELLGERGEKLGLRIGLDMGLGRRVESVAVELADVRGDRGPKPSVGGFFGRTFVNLGICKRGRADAVVKKS